MSKANDLTGRTFGLLKVLRRVEDVKPGRPMWLCECRCGKSVVKSSTSLAKQNGVKSCGCLRHQKSPELIDLTDMPLEIFGFFIRIVLHKAAKLVGYANAAAGTLFLFSPKVCAAPKRHPAAANAKS